MKKSQLRIQIQIGPFICNNRLAGEEADSLLKQMRFSEFHLGIWPFWHHFWAEDSQAKEVAETEGHKEEILKLIMEQNAQKREMEEEMDKSIKEKEQSVQMAIIPLETVPLTGDQKIARGS